MSTLTTISSGTEEFLEVEELVDTRLSLVIGAGSPQHPPGQPLLPLTEKEASAGRKRKRASTVKGGSDINDDSGGSGARKKLQLTGEQAAAMEKSFRAHNVLSHDEKHDLARRLGLKARQVEVWFQNRRARTKLKQTELDCGLLRRLCERLSHDNERLRRDLAEARSSLSSAAFISSLTSSSCPSCNKPGGGWPGVGLINRD
ncbi:putative homeobox-leucine zipper protein HOX26 [Lolium perenne]|uniref:putative homeobox-leucine zipper protein HOX26 n=1 Tax=Lolium perenne TaxID=4522 RepID=UPI0021EA59EA|nr:putative homeobox-leucine zipper protein HOX26 [Lolium perenne]